MANTISKTAKKVNEVFPSFDELMNDAKYKAHQVLHPLQKYAFSKSQQWEGIAMAVDNMSRHMFGRPFYNFYIFNNEKGHAEIINNSGKSITVEFEEFCALIKIVFLFNMGVVEPTRKQYEAYLHFKSSDDRMFNILD